MQTSMAKMSSNCLAEFKSTKNGLSDELDTFQDFQESMQRRYWTFEEIQSGTPKQVCNVWKEGGMDKEMKDILDLKSRSMREYVVFMV